MYFKRALLGVVVVGLVALALWSALTGAGETDSGDPTKFYSVIPRGRPGPTLPGPDDIPELEVYQVWEGTPPFPDMPAGEWEPEVLLPQSDPPYPPGGGAWVVTNDNAWFSRDPLGTAWKWDPADPEYGAGFWFYDYDDPYWPHFAAFETPYYPPRFLWMLGMNDWYELVWTDPDYAFDIGLAGYHAYIDYCFIVRTAEPNVGGEGVDTVTAWIRPKGITGESETFLLLNDQNAYWPYPGEPMDDPQMENWYCRRWYVGIIYEPHEDGYQIMINGISDLDNATSVYLNPVIVWKGVEYGHALHLPIVQFGDIPTR